MRYHKFSVLFVSILFLVSMMLTSCSSSSDNPDPLDIVGTWLLVPIGYDVISPVTITITAHTAAGAGGVVATATPGGGDPAYITGITTTTDGAPAVKNPRGISIEITFNDGSVLTMTGTVSDNNSSMAGRYTNTQGDSDNWSANRQ